MIVFWPIAEGIVKYVIYLYYDVYKYLVFRPKVLPFAPVSGIIKIRTIEAGDRDDTERTQQKRTAVPAALLGDQLRRDSERCASGDRA